MHPSSPHPAHHPHQSRALSYSDYINDQEIVESLRLPPQPIDASGQPVAAWPVVPPDWKPGDPWPTGERWSHDEALFIRTHQAFEVWFWQVLHEIGSVISEAGQIWQRFGAAGRGRIPRIELDLRAPDSPSYDPRRFPSLDKVLAELVAKDPALSLLAHSIGDPGRQFQVSGLAPAAAATLFERLPVWVSRLDRACKAFMCTIPFFDVLATLTSVQFLEFRDRLQPASGFGSAQFRELELAMGLRELNAPRLQPAGGEQGGTDKDGNPLPPEILRPTKDTPGPQRMSSFYESSTTWGLSRIATRWREPSLRDLVYALLNTAREWSPVGVGAQGAGLPPHAIPDLSDSTIDRFAAVNLQKSVGDSMRGIRSPIDPATRERLTDGAIAFDRAMAHRETIVASLFEMHHGDSRLKDFFHACLRMDSALLRWRDAHIRFVEGQIGMRRGTGGGGIQYLRTTTAADRGPHYTHAFPCLWQARSFVQASL